MEEINNIVEQINEMQDEKDIPKNIKTKLLEVAQILKNDGEEVSLKIDKALSELEEISEDVNIPTHVRMYIYNLSSVLESIRS